MLASLRVTLLAAAVLSTANSAQAERDLRARPSNQWLGQQMAVLGGLTLANVAALSLITHAIGPGLDMAYLGEGSIEVNDSPLTAYVTDGLLLASLGAPLGTLATHGGRAWGNSLLIYGEALELSLLVNTLVKRGVKRARPFTHGDGGRARATAIGANSYYSFYSGHSALSFTAATASSVLFAAVESSEAWSSAHFASTFALAALTAHGRVRAGMHYPTDVVVGSFLGVACGLLVPGLARVSLAASPTQIASASGGALAGFLAGYLLPKSVGARDEVLGLLGQVAFLPGGAVLQLDLSRLGRASAHY